jgi:hypothetical protein
MAKKCTVEECNYPVFSRGYCKIHQRLRKDKKPKAIKSVSDKMAVMLKVYKEKREKFLERYPKCQAGIEGCTKYSSQVHHRRGRLGELLINTEYFLAVCYSCHHYIEMHPLEAKEKGWSLMR